MSKTKATNGLIDWINEHDELNTSRTPDYVLALTCPNPHAHVKAKCYKMITVLYTGTSNQRAAV